MKGIAFTKDVLKLRKNFKFLSAIKYALLLRGLGPEIVSVRLRHHLRYPFFIRKTGSDQYTFAEIFEENIYSIAADNIQDCKTMVDLGANIGLASLYFLSRFPSLCLVGVEANPYTYNVLNRNLKRFIESNQASLIQAAIWKNDGWVVGDDHGKPNHFSMFSVREALPSDLPGSSNIRALSMATLIKYSKFEKIDLLKVDIEGGEEEIFTGDNSWMSLVRCVVIEFHGKSRLNSRFDEIASKFGFTILSDDGWVVIAIRKQA